MVERHTTSDPYQRSVPLSPGRKLFGEIYNIYLETFPRCGFFDFLVITRKYRFFALLGTHRIFGSYTCIPPIIRATSAQWLLVQ